MSNKLLHTYRPLLGKRIAKIEYITHDECNEMMWHNRPVAIVFEDGSYIVPVCDDEGNDGGSIWYSGEEGEITLCTSSVIFKEEEVA